MEENTILERLRSLRGIASAVAIAEELAALRGEYSQGAFVNYFKRAFPDIPLNVLTECGGWHRLSDGGISDEQFAAKLSPWLDGVRRTKRRPGRET